VTFNNDGAPVRHRIRSATLTGGLDKESPEDEIKAYEVERERNNIGAIGEAVGEQANGGERRERRPQHVERLKVGVGKHEDHSRIGTSRPKNALARLNSRLNLIEYIIHRRKYCSQYDGLGRPKGGEVRKLLKVRIVRWPFKLLYVVGAYGILVVLVNLLALLRLPAVAGELFSLVLDIAVVLYGARVFRGRNEDLEAPRELWRMTARRPLSKRLGVLFTIIAASELVGVLLGLLRLAGVDLGRFNFFSIGVMGIAFATAEYGILAFLYLRSASHMPIGRTFTAEPSDRIDRIYDLFNRRLAAEIMGYLHPDVEWPNGWEGGYVRGRRGVRDYWKRQWKEIDPKVTPLGIHIEEDGQLTVRVHQVVHDVEGKLISDTELEHVYRARDGLFDRMEIRELPARAS
jgi:hypothetical protein